MSRRHHSRWACALFKAMEGRVGRGKGVERLEIVKNCVQGVLAVICLSSQPSRAAPAGSSRSGGRAELDLDWLEGLCTAHTTSLALNHNAGRGGLFDDAAVPNTTLERPSLLHP
ncbi:hypothetical protein CVT26_015450 [Gymnopilus dilepis]|uniref:Uncharacterized protein n=1 Tax=Gymnopilus dilepis TaxID=231916 RepID=A0A409W4G4_9AGAR|nr:hypothetical protein CVT26_015450 [Gymnopilus dilepis]